MNAVIPLIPISNRKIKRGYDKERKKVEHLLVDIECEFEFAIFNAPKELSYIDLYKYFLDKWHDVTKSILVQFEFIYVAVDLHHFPRMYKPQV